MPDWPSLTYDNMVSHGGIAFTYFNTTLRSELAPTTTAEKSLHDGQQDGAHAAVAA